MLILLLHMIDFWNVDLKAIHYWAGIAQWEPISQKDDSVRPPSMCGMSMVRLINLS